MLFHDSFNLFVLVVIKLRLRLDYWRGSKLFSNFLITLNLFLLLRLIALILTTISSWITSESTWNSSETTWRCSIATSKIRWSTSKARWSSKTTSKTATRASESTRSRDSISEITLSWSWESINVEIHSEIIHVSKCTWVCSIFSFFLLRSICS